MIPFLRTWLRNRTPNTLGPLWVLYGPTSQGLEYRCRECGLRWYVRGFWDAWWLVRDRWHEGEGR